MTETAVCVDFGSTWTKALHVAICDGAVLGTASHPTTLDDVMVGYDACLAELGAADARAGRAEVRACSSAGGGLRIAVVGNEELVTAEAGRRVALSSGGKVVAVVALAADGSGDELESTLRVAQPDVVLLTGGTDGGNSEALLTGARLLAEVWGGPVVVAGNADARDEVARVLAGHAHVLADNVVPRIGVLAPGSARSRIREMFLAHVIGGKGLTARPEFAGLVRGATPDVVLTGVEVLARLVAPRGRGVAVVDVGGATTDVYSVVELDADSVGREVVATTAATRTVEGDLGVRWSAPATLAAADGAVLPAGDGAVLPAGAGLGEYADRVATDPGSLPADERDAAYDEQLAGLAAGLALRRHAGRARVVLGPGGKVVEREGVDLREVGLLVASGGVFRHGAAGVEGRVLAGLGSDASQGWLVPEDARVVVDRSYVLAAAGLLAADHPQAAAGLAASLVSFG